MSRLIEDSLEAQRKADAAEAARIEVRLKVQSDRRTREERIIQLVAQGWSLRTAREAVRTRSLQHTWGEGIVGAYEAAQDKHELGLDPAKCHDRKSGRKRRHRKTAWGSAAPVDHLDLLPMATARRGG